MDRYDAVSNKVISPENLDATLAYWRFRDHRIVFTNGCFDILHLGHVEYLARASSLGDVMVVGLNTDSSVKRIKGPERPVQDERSRSLILASLQFISAVVLFDEDTPYELIKKIQPDILIKGADYKPEDIVGYDIVRRKGGTVKTINLTEGYSTTGILTRIK